LEKDVADRRADKHQKDAENGDKTNHSVESGYFYFHI